MMWGLSQSHVSMAVLLLRPELPLFFQGSCVPLTAVHSPGLPSGHPACLIPHPGPCRDSSPGPGSALARGQCPWVEKGVAPSGPCLGMWSCSLSLYPRLEGEG